MISWDFLHVFFFNKRSTTCMLLTFPNIDICAIWGFIVACIVALRKFIFFVESWFIL